MDALGDGPLQRELGHTDDHLLDLRHGHTRCQLHWDDLHDFHCSFLDLHDKDVNDLLLDPIGDALQRHGLHHLHELVHRLRNENVANLFHSSLLPTHTWEDAGDSNNMPLVQRDRTMLLIDVLGDGLLRDELRHVDGLLLDLRHP